MKSGELTDELGGCRFGDERLTKRACRLFDALGKYPNFSIPAALKSKADIEACYRFFNNDQVTPERIVEPHIEATYQRSGAVDFALLVQDTTAVDLTRPEKQVAGAGPMDGESRRGAFFHPMIAFDADGVPLGLVGQKSWARSEISKAPKIDKCHQRRRTAIEEKESYRWLEGLRCAERTAMACPETTCVCVGDSESDIYDVFAAATASEQDHLQLLVRTGQNRNTIEQQDWAEQVRATQPVGRQSVTVRA